jgi:putative two-component system hydrogenase maturation factor HypX/HoxX
VNSRGLRILLLTHAFNGLAQRLFIALHEAGHAVSVELDIADAVTLEALDLWRADLVVAPYLKRRLPEAVWRRVPCLVVHPGPPGDRGPSALDWAILRGERDWAVSVLQATDDVDGGPLWAWQACSLRAGATKSSLYRREVSDAAVAAVLAAVAAFQRGPAAPPTLPPWPRAPHGWRPLVTRAQRAVDWASDDTDAVLRKLHSADGAPGATAVLAGSHWRLFDAHPASPAVLDRFLGSARLAAPGTLLARRGPAVLVATRDAALWIGHLRGTGEHPAHALKRPAVEHLSTACTGLPKSVVALEAPADEWTELRLEQWGPPGARVGWLSFEMHNGALDERQCRALGDALAAVAAMPLQVLVLAGGEDFFCNGIHLHGIEAAAHRPGDGAADASWRNIQAIDDVVLALLTMTDRITVAALRGNAGAGGCFVALAADRVWAHPGVVLNPHYRNMGNLYGSEYWTYTLPRRIGGDAAAALMRRRWPSSALQACCDGLVDACLGRGAADFESAARAQAGALAADPGLAEHIAAKAAVRAADEARQPLAAYRQAELERMQRNFYGFDPSYHVARHHFVHRKPHAWTPRHLALHR